MRRWWLVLASACACAVACSSPPATSTSEPAFAAKPGDLAITDVTVVPMTSDGELAHRTVVIRGDTIVAVAPAPGIELPPGVTQIAGAGKWLMPGLADMHVHTWSEDDLTLFVAAGVTTIRNMWGVPEHVLWRAQVERGERLGPTIVTAGALFDGAPPDWPGSIVITDPAAADALVVAQKEAGYDFIKSVARLQPAAYRALAAATEAHGMVLAGHTPYAVGVEGVLAAHQRSIEHLDGYPAALVPPGIALPSVDDPAWAAAVLAKLDPARLPALVARTIAAGSWNCPTLTVYDRAPELHSAAEMEHHVQWLAEIPAARRARWIHDFASAKVTADDTATTRAWNAELGTIAAALVAANAPILVGTDTGGAFLVPGEALHDELELLVAAGIPRARVIRAATAEAWRFLGKPHVAGVVEVGARADLLLVSIDPLTTPLPLIPDGVMVRGRWLPHDELVAKLAEVAAHDEPPDRRVGRTPPPAPDGELVRSALYRVSLTDASSAAGTQVAAERLVIGTRDHARTIVGDIVDPEPDVDTHYRIAADRVAIAATYHTMTLDITGAVTGGELVVTGTDLAHAPVSLRAPIPAGTIVVGPGLGGWISLVDRLGGMAVGAHRRVAALELAYYPAIAITPLRYDVTRQQDGLGMPTYTITTTRDGDGAGVPVTSAVVTDRDGFVRSRVVGDPDGTTTTLQEPDR